MKKLKPTPRMVMSKIEIWVGIEGLAVKFPNKQGRFLSNKEALAFLKEELPEILSAGMQLFENLALLHAKSYNMPVGQCRAPKCPWCFPDPDELAPQWVSDLCIGQSIPRAEEKT